MDKKGQKKEVGLFLKLIALMFIILIIPSTGGLCPEIDNNNSCDNVIKNYIIDEGIDIRTLNSEVGEPAHLSGNNKTCTRVEQPDRSNEYESCTEIYSSLYPNDGAEGFCIDNSQEKDWIEGPSFDFYSLIAESEGSLPEAWFCWGCESGTYETADNDYYCECDEDEKCFDYFTKSTAVAGGSWACFSSCSYQSGTDYCSGLNTLVEYYVDCYCCDEVFSVTKNCNDYNSYSTQYNYCSGNEVWAHKWYWDYDCGTGACFYDSAGSGWTDDQYVQTCACGCSNGQCDYPCPPSIRVSPTSLNFVI